MIEDEVLFTPQLATVVVELHREITSVLDYYCGISYLELCLLASIQTHRGSMSLADFPVNTCSNTNTVIAATTRLHEKGLCVKTKSPHDRRMIVLHETIEGKALLKEGVEHIYQQLKRTVWQKHSDEDIDEIMQSFKAQVKAFGIKEIEVNRYSHPVITPAYFLSVAVILNRWINEVKTFSGLSLTEFRCLLLLGNRPTPLTCSKIAETLIMDRSSITAVITSLKNQCFVTVAKGSDRRSKEVALTEKGEVCAALITAKLSRATAELYSSIDSQLKSKTNELHMRMYSAFAYY